MRPKEMRPSPKGAGLMPRVGLKRLTGAHKKEKAGKSKYRLHAALLRKEGRGIRKTSRVLGYGLLDRPGLAGPHARRQPEEAVR